MSAPEATKVIGLPGGLALHLVVGDLLAQSVDAIVNAANGYLAHGGGVAAVIARAAGPELEREGRAYVAAHGPVPTGEATVTTAGDLPFRGVIHAVGPRQGEGDEEAKLTQAVSNALLRAHERGWASVAMPAISSGIFSVPPALCARAYVAGVRRHVSENPGSSVRDVTICLLEGPLVALVSAAMDATSADAGTSSLPG